MQYKSGNVSTLFNLFSYISYQNLRMYKIKWLRLCLLITVIDRLELCVHQWSTYSGNDEGVIHNPDDPPTIPGPCTLDIEPKCGHVLMEPQYIHPTSNLYSCGHKVVINNSNITQGVPAGCTSMKANTWYRFDGYVTIEYTFSSTPIVISYEGKQQLEYHIFFINNRTVISQYCEGWKCFIKKRSFSFDQLFLLRMISFGHLIGKEI